MAYWKVCTILIIVLLSLLPFEAFVVPNRIGSNVKRRILAGKTSTVGNRFCDKHARLRRIGSYPLSSTSLRATFTPLTNKLSVLETIASEATSKPTPAIPIATAADGTTVLQAATTASSMSQLVPRRQLWLEKALLSVSVPLITLSSKLFRSFFSAHGVIIIAYHLAYIPILKRLHQVQCWLWHKLRLGNPLPWKDSILGFVAERGQSLGKILLGNYALAVAFQLLPVLGFNHVRDDFPIFVSRLSLSLFAINFADLFLNHFLPVLSPSLGENRRQLYVLRRSLSVLVWVVGSLVVCEMISTFLRIPMTSLLAFGGVGGLAIGLSTKDIVGNFLGGMLLLINEPFTPGDMILFKSGGTDMEGRVERVGWNQIRLRAKDTRCFYIPNSLFVNAAVTNIERMTHRRVEYGIRIRMQDIDKLPTVISNIKQRLLTLPKLDSLTQPFRIHFTSIGNNCFVIDMTFFFETRSLDEFLNLQQVANFEIVKAVHEAGADFANQLYSVPSSWIT